MRLPTIGRSAIVLPPWATPPSLCKHAPPAAIGTSRRALLAVLLPAAITLPNVLTPLPAFAETPSLLTPSKMLTAGEYLNDIRAARRGLDELRPLLEVESPRLL